VSKVSKLVAILLIAVVVAAGAGYWLFSPKPSSEIVNYTSAETSLEVNRRTPEQTLTTSTSSPTASAAETTLWINVTAAKPVSYYISLLKAAGAQPYVELGWELQALPDATNATAVAKITYLALDATNPEVKEAFTLMMNGGTPDPGDFTYSVPQYNTELQVLYRLAEQNEFKKDDTLALSIAMVNGLWVTMGDEQVRQAVYNDTSDLLKFFRETNEIQAAGGYYRLEGYPLEAKVALVWTGGYTTLGTRVFPLLRYRSTRLPLEAYKWDSISIETLENARSSLLERHWVGRNNHETIRNLEDYFFGEFLGTGHNHWIYTGQQETTTMIIDGIQVLNHDFGNSNFVLKYFLSNGVGIGDCGEESNLVNTYAKSYGIPTLITLNWAFKSEKSSADNLFWTHARVIFYEEAGVWRVYEKQIYPNDPQETQAVVSGNIPYFYIFVPFINQEFPRGDFNFWNIYLPRSTRESNHTLLVEGIPRNIMKQWINAPVFQLSLPR
jgi:hypothetical protein